jgi:hypothetical protein
MAPQKAEVVALKPPPAGEPPPVMSVDDAILISDELNGVFDSKTGYADGLTDAGLAEKLNVPRAWVRDVRVRKFGEARGDNAQIRELVAQARLLLEDFKKGARAVDAALAELKRAKDAADFGLLKHRCEVLEKRLDDLLAATK